VKNGKVVNSDKGNTGANASGYIYIVDEDIFVSVSLLLVVEPVPLQCSSTSIFYTKCMERKLLTRTKFTTIS
jgi:hypothetical protein